MTTIAEALRTLEARLGSDDELTGPEGWAKLIGATDLDPGEVMELENTLVREFVLKASRGDDVGTLIKSLFTMGLVLGYDIGQVSGYATGREAEDADS